jgi:hypothetical protein
VSYIAVAALVALVALVLLVVARRTPKRPPSGDQPHASTMGDRPRFDTTIGEFHDLRDALRPLEHTRAASRTLPRGRR